MEIQSPYNKEAKRRLIAFAVGFLGACLLLAAVIMVLL